jgi:hypothetical protein
MGLGLVTVIPLPSANKISLDLLCKSSCISLIKRKNSKAPRIEPQS